MGNWVAVEAIRQINLSGHAASLKKLGSIILAAPDIDIDVFKSQMRSIGKPRRPFYIILSKDDKALRASNFLAGGDGRLGAANNVNELAKLGAIVVDMTDVEGRDSANHGKFAALAQLGPKFGSVLAGGIGAGYCLPRNSAHRNVTRHQAALRVRLMPHNSAGSR